VRSPWRWSVLVARSAPDGVFLSYRRDDTEHVAGRLADRIGQRYGNSQVFLDVDSVAPGADFVDAVQAAVSSCTVLLALIGPFWVDATDAKGRRRLDVPEDYVALELRTALQRGVPILPVLVDGAKMPAESALPADLRPLSRRNAVHLDGESFQPDVTWLLSQLEKFLGSAEHVSAGKRLVRIPVSRRMLLSAVVAALVAVAITVALRRGGGGAKADSWTRIADMPLALEAPAVATYRDRLFVIGGVSAKQERGPLDTVQVYDPATNRWSIGPTLPVPLNHAAAVSTGDSIYVLGGLAPDGSTAAVYRLDSPDGKWREDRPLPDARGAGAAAFDGGRIVFGGGVARDGLARADVWAMVPGQEWVDAGHLEPAREKLASTTDGYGRVWFMGGRDIRAAPGEKTYGNVDIVTKTEVQHLGEAIPPISAPGGVQLPGHGMCVVGGQLATGEFNAGIHCVGRQAEAPAPNLPTPRAGLGVAVLRDQVYAIAGYYLGVNGTSLSQVYRVPPP
jgi:TIR domain/Kelch motif